MLLLLILANRLWRARLHLRRIGHQNSRRGHPLSTRRLDLLRHIRTTGRLLAKRLSRSLIPSPRPHRQPVLDPLRRSWTPSPPHAKRLSRSAIPLCRCRILSLQP
jgi:hypothetical protein